MSNQKVLEQVLQAFCEETDLNSADLTAQTQILELNLDSVDYMKVMLSVEARFDFEFQNEDLNLEGYGTIAQFADFVAEHYLNGEEAPEAEWRPSCIQEKCGDGIPPTGRQNVSDEN